jgi:predicted ATPase/DNA-binding SARP family transcriptional activator/Tfp pilus assembly protein PilF
VATSAESQLDVRVLGPIEAISNGAPLPLGGPRQRALLALLALEPGRIVPADRLTDELWNGRPPDGADITLRSYVSRLRGAIGESAEIRARGAGYARDVQADAVDAVRFERLVREGETALESRRPRRAAEELAEGLALWRGRAFGDVGDDGALAREAERLEELRLHALETQIEADLELGRSAELIDRLEALVREHPYRERFWRQLMLALYRSDRQVDALAAYQRARIALEEQLGLEPGEQLQALERAVLRHEIPQAEPPEQRHNLPAPVTSFVGREAELREIARLLGTARQVTLNGVGGVGKTRLGIEVARTAAIDFPDGVFFVDLAPIADPELVAGRLAEVLDIREQGEVPIVERMATHLRLAEVLLVLDNCEQVRAATARVASRLLETCPRLRILATSRDVLGIPGEVAYAVPPLAVPSTTDGSALRDSEAVRLFMARARESRPSLADDDATLATIAGICADLDGLPLAIELAAARARALSPGEIAARLTDRFRFLVSWRRLTTARHRTLREAMDWSYELLGPEEQWVLAGLSVFVGGFSLAAVAAVCLEGDEERALEIIERLIEASLVSAEEGSPVDEGETRYHLLETVRQYAAQRLAALDATAELRRSHAAWCRSLSEEAAPELSGSRQASWYRRLEVEHDNLRAALNWFAETGDAPQLLQLAIALTRFWYVRGHLSEGRRWLAGALAADRERDPILRRRALTAAASLALLQGDHAEATSLAEESLAVARQTGSSNFVANALSNLGAIVLAGGDTARAGTLLEEAVAVARTAGDDRILALAINNLGDLELTRGRYERARPLFEESLALLRARGDTSNVARSLFNLGATEWKVGAPDEAAGHFREALANAQEAGDQEDLAWILQGIAALAAGRGQAERASLLLGASESLLDAMGAEYKPFERQLRDETDAAIRALIGDGAAAPGLARGRSLAIPEAIELALADL